MRLYQGSTALAVILLPALMSLGTMTAQASYFRLDLLNPSNTIAPNQAADFDVLFGVEPSGVAVELAAFDVVITFDQTRFEADFPSKGAGPRQLVLHSEPR